MNLHAWSPVVNCWTIDDGSVNDDGSALLYMHQQFPQAKLSINNQSAANNLASCPDGGNWMMCGHGNVGVIVTGGGVSPGFDQVVADWNPFMWEPLFAPLKGNVQVLRLMGCQIGAEQKGADLLFRLATVLNCGVLAPTGLVFAGPGGVHTETGDPWQGANPNQVPLPKPIYTGTGGAQGGVIGGFGGTEPYRFVRGKEIVDVPFGAIDKVTVARHPKSPLSESSVIPLGREHTHVLLSMIALGRPILIEGQPLAMPTASLRVTIDGVETSFRVYNDRLLQDALNPTTYYEVAAGFPGALQHLI